jgi:hypothetical protein
MMRAALTLISVATRGIADMKTLYKLYVLVGESWYCCNSYDKSAKAEEAERTLKQQGDTTMIRRVLM